MGGDDYTLWRYLRSWSNINFGLVIGGKMATKIIVQHKDSGILKSGYFGFSWKTFLFGPFPSTLAAVVLLLSANQSMAQQLKADTRVSVSIR